MRARAGACIAHACVCECTHNLRAGDCESEGVCFSAGVSFTLLCMTKYASKMYYAADLFCEYISNPCFCLIQATRALSQQRGTINSILLLISVIYDLMSMDLYWSLWTTCQMTVTVGLCCCTCVTFFER